METIKTELNERHRKCCIKKGKEYSYNTPLSIDRYLTRKEFNIDYPFDYKDCKKLNMEKDDTNRFYKNIKTKNQCNIINGYWNSADINRENLVERGVCYVRKDDMTCSIYNLPELISKNNILTSDKTRQRNLCDKNKGCIWNKLTNECLGNYSGAFLKIPVLPDTWPEDISSKNFQEYLNMYYSKLLSEKPSDYSELISNKNRCDINNTKEFLLTQPQSIVNIVFKGFSNPSSVNRGLLVWHSTGSGKTCTAAGIIESFWESDKNIVFISSIEAIASNPPENFMNCLIKFFPRFENKSIDDMIKEFNRRKIRFMTFSQITHYLQLYRPVSTKDKRDKENHENLLQNAVLIIDEVHNIFNPLPNQKKEHFALRDFLMDINNPKISNIKIAILTATPGKNEEEVLDLLNMIRKKNSKKIKLPDFKNKQSIEKFGKSIRGLISYFNMNLDYSRFPKINFMKANMISMSLNQYSKYIEAFISLKENLKNYDDLVKNDKEQKYYKQARKYSNTLYNYPSNIELNEFSSKMPSLLYQINKYKNEKHYIYSAFFENRGYGGHGVRAIANILESLYDYEMITLEEAIKFNKTGKISKKPRYILAINNILSTTGTTSSIGPNLKEFINLFNHDKNKNGAIVNIFLASQKYNEGIDLKSVRNIHIFEPLLNFNSETQTIGRGVRYCSHSQLDKSKWEVKVHRYLADFPVELINLVNYNNFVKNIKKKIEKLKSENNDKRTSEVKKLEKQLIELNIDNRPKDMIDFKILNEVNAKMKIHMRLLNIMKSYSIDCVITKNFHANENFKCLK